MVDSRFFPCNIREGNILVLLQGDAKDEYKRLRHGGMTVTEAWKSVSDDPIPDNERRIFFRDEYRPLK